MTTPILSRNNRIQILIHVMVWGVVFCTPLFFMTSESSSFSWLKYLGFMSSPLAMLVVFYLNYFVLIDRLLFRKRLWLFLLANFVLIVILTFGLHEWHEYHRALMGWRPRAYHKMRWQDFYFMFIVRDGLTMVLIAALSVAIKMTGRWYRTEAEKQLAEKERTEAELRNLKNQLNPHFLFNTLNNIYALVALNPSQAQYAVHSLSKLLRYVLYENNQDRMPLSKEIAFLKSYIELMSLRLPKQVTLEVSLPNEETSCEIPPLLFIALIENAFKHGVSPTEPSHISISIAFSAASTLVCTIENSYFPKEGNDRSGSGIGIENLRRRLSLLYPASHILRMEHLGDNYVAQLILHLKVDEES